MGMADVDEEIHGNTTGKGRRRMDMNPSFWDHESGSVCQAFWMELHIWLY